MKEDDEVLKEHADFLGYLYSRIDAQERTIMFLLFAAILNAAGLIIISLSFTWGG